jgi:hypothetical protein
LVVASPNLKVAARSLIDISANSTASPSMLLNLGFLFVTALLVRCLALGFFLSLWFWLRRAGLRFRLFNRIRWQLVLMTGYAPENQSTDHRNQYSEDELSEWPVPPSLFLNTA